jgi:hypothetical protein
MSQWVRLWDDMPTDPKWRLIARKSGRSISEVIAVFNFMLICAANSSNANANASERGELNGWDDEDVATALDLEIEDVLQIRNTMQGKVLDGMRLKAWKKRQPLREDSSAERAKAWRERKRTQDDASRTHQKRRYTESNSNEFDSARGRARQKNRSTNGQGRSNGTEGFVRSVLEDIENDRRRREESAAEVVPMLQCER